MSEPSRVQPTQPYYLPVHGGKYHRANPVTSQARCRGTLLLDTTAMPLHVATGAEKVHPMVCARCVADQNATA